VRGNSYVDIFCRYEVRRQQIVVKRCSYISVTTKNATTFDPGSYTLLYLNVCTSVSVRNGR